MFHNIFSSQKEQKEKPKETIIVDHREKNSLVSSILIENNVQIEWQQLPVGDYIIKGIIVERKTYADLQASIITKRIFSQLGNLPKEQSLLIIEGTGEQRIKQEAIQGFLLSCALVFKIPYIITKNEQETAEYLIRLTTRKKAPLSLTPPKPQSFKEQQQFVLQAFPGIGPKTAEKLLAQFKTIKNIVNASEQDLLPFLGKKTTLFLKLLQTET
jgi:Fanconi anemia group M protein